MPKLILSAVPILRQTYISKILGMNPLAFWPMNEASGTACKDISGSGYNGTYSNVTLAQPGIGDGATSASFNGTNSSANVFSAGLAGAINDQEYTIMMWAKVSGAGVWTDGAQRRMCFFGFGADPSNDHFYLRKNTTNNQLRLGRAGTALPHKSIDHTISTTSWFHIGMTCSKANDRLKLFINGSQSGSTLDTLQEILNTLTVALLGCYSGAFYWSGYLGRAALFDRELSGAEMSRAGRL